MRWRGGPTAADFKAQEDMQTKVALYPHLSLVRKALPCDMEEIRSAGFIPRIFNLHKIASQRSLLSVSAPKVHWSAQVILLKAEMDQTEYEVWVNPNVPGYDDRRSVAPMYGMWETCCSCGESSAWVIRPQKIKCYGFDQYGKEKEEMLEGIKARLLMHELDHLRGLSMFQQTLSPDFIISRQALFQTDLWPPGFPSMEAAMTPPGMFWDYVSNTMVQPKGLEWLFAAQQAQSMGAQRKLEPV
jgi:peptide deformylase